MSEQTIDAGRLKKPVMVVRFASGLKDGWVEKKRQECKEAAEAIGMDVVFSHEYADVSIIQPIQSNDHLAVAITALVESNHALIEAIMERDDHHGDGAPDLTPVEKYL